MSLWVPLYETSAESVKSVISTFFKVFPNGIIWSNDTNGVGYDIVLYGQAEPTHIDIDKLEKKVYREDHAMVRQSLGEVGFYNLGDLLGTYAGRGPDLQEWMAGAQINSDRNLRLGYLAGIAINNTQAPEIFFRISKYYKFPKDMFSGSAQKIESLHFTIENKMKLILEQQNPPF